MFLFNALHALLGWPAYVLAAIAWLGVGSFVCLPAVNPIMKWQQDEHPRKTENEKQIDAAIAYFFVMLFWPLSAMWGVAYMFIKSSRESKLAAAKAAAKIAKEELAGFEDIVRNFDPSGRLTEVIDRVHDKTDDLTDQAKDKFEDLRTRFERERGGGGRRERVNTYGFND